ncbi:MAG: hypothetical protein JWQ70_3226 [Aeromicrobium sp.]|nr:hypothetical protein [Aeromicrobium sp.]
MATDIKALDKNTQGALIAGVLGFILSLFSYYISFSTGVSDSTRDIAKKAGVNIPSDRIGFTAWESYATFGMILVLAALAVLAVRTFAPATLPKDVPWNLITLGLAGLGTFLVILRALTWPGSGNIGWSGYALFVALLALSYFAFALFKSSGEKIPEFNKGTPPAA